MELLNTMINNQMMKTEWGGRSGASSVSWGNVGGREEYLGKWIAWEARAGTGCIVAGG